MESRGLGAATSSPAAPTGKQKAPVKKSVKPAEVGVLLNVLIHIFQNDLRIHRRLLSPDPHTHPRSSLQAQGKKKKKKSKKSRRYLQRFGNDSSSPPRGLRTRLVILQGLEKQQKQTKIIKKKKKTHIIHIIQRCGGCPCVRLASRSRRRAVAVRRHTAPCFYLKNTRLFHFFSVSGEIQKVKVWLTGVEITDAGGKANAFTFPKSPGGFYICTVGPPLF